MTTRTFRIFYALRSAAFHLGETIMQTAEQLDVTKIIGVFNLERDI